MKLRWLVSLLMTVALAAAACTPAEGGSSPEGSVPAPAERSVDPTSSAPAPAERSVDPTSSAPAPADFYGDY